MGRDHQRAFWSTSQCADDPTLCHAVHLPLTVGHPLRVICVVSCVRGQFPVYPSQPTYRRAQVPSVRGIMRPRRTGGSWRILLQKSFWDDERKFSKALARVARGDVRDHIVSRKNHHGPAYRRHGAFQH